jgi:hypothetical protein
LKKEHSTIIELIKSYLEKHPDQRFGQVLFNLGINEFKESPDPRNLKFSIRDIHNDKDSDIIERIERQLAWFDIQRKVNEGISRVEGIEGMTINERLIATDLMEHFDSVKVKNKEYARYILKSLKVDNESIDRILK